MINQFGSKLILVEGLTGSGKSTMAHFIARQLQYNGISASWVHEGADPHPFLIDLDTNIEDYLAGTREKWAAYFNQVRSAPDVKVLEACFFNNLLETVLAHKVGSQKILQFADELLVCIKPLNPTLIYLVQDDVDKALERNFKRRGDGFRNYVIEYATSTPLAVDSGWAGFAGMLLFWQAFVSLTDELFTRFPGRKLMIDNTAGDWEDYYRKVSNFLSILLIPDQKIIETEVQSLIGVYKSKQSGQEFIVWFDSGKLTINVHSNERTKLVRRSEFTFEAEGWPFEISFECDDLSGKVVLRIAGGDVDYLPLVGTVADKITS